MKFSSNYQYKQSQYFIVQILPIKSTCVSPFCDSCQKKSTEHPADTMPTSPLPMSRLCNKCHFALQNFILELECFCVEGELRYEHLIWLLYSLQCSPSLCACCLLFWICNKFCSGCAISSKRTLCLKHSLFLSPFTFSATNGSKTYLVASRSFKSPARTLL